ncbi:MAG TPA: nicotinate-nucleotide diphosphorylase (carboxylating), partial [Flavobacteriales bacterium]|nr:nicotinate-nucleotide diphosphorylase (carboxylating) [Flavobacteriales bacterium]
MLDKYAVACGGGKLHRLGLHDAALYKDNHLANLKDFSAKLGDVLLDVKKKNEIQFAEVEVDSLEQLEKVLDLPVDIVLLDNMTNDELSQAVAMRNKSTPSILLEASGGVTLETVRAVAETGVDRVAIGALTHDAPWLDIGLDKLDA